MTTRRTFLKNGGALLTGAALHRRSSFGVDAADTPRSPLPTPAQLAWQDCEIGLVYHFDMPIAAGNFAGNNTARQVFDTRLYNPAKLDTDQWIEAAKAAGAKYKGVQRRFGKPVAETTGAGNTIELELPKPGRINHMIAMEDIARGERIRQYVLEGLVPGGTWQPLCSDECVGHKRIQSFDSTEVAAVRLRVSEAKATPRIRRLAVFDVA